MLLKAKVFHKGRTKFGQQKKGVLIINQLYLSTFSILGISHHYYFEK